MIDWTFIQNCEGGQLLDGYVPQPGKDGDRSGVTIAAGVDIGQMTNGDLAGLPDALQKKIIPYLGLNGAAARTALARCPLSITAAEAEALEMPARDRTVSGLSVHYLRDAAMPFERLPDASQTVMASVSYQYGAIWVRTPHFWAHAIKPDFQGMYDDLENFGDPYPTRRRKEAAYLKAHLPNGAIA